MELVIDLTPTTRVTVRDIEDYHVKPTFDPNAACDTEYYGYRETTFKVVEVEYLTTMYDTGVKMWLPDDNSSQYELDFLASYFDDKLTLLVQDKLDEMEVD